MSIYFLSCYRQIDIDLNYYTFSVLQEILSKHNRQINRLIDRQIDIQIDRQIDRQVDRQIGGQVDRQIDRQIDRQMLAHFVQPFGRLQGTYIRLSCFIIQINLVELIIHPIVINLFVYAGYFKIHGLLKGLYT